MISTTNSGKTPQSYTAKTLLAVACLLPAPLAAADGGGGSAALYSLDPASPSLGTGPFFSAATIFVDDATNDGVLTVGLPPGGLRLLPGDNLMGLSGGTDNGIPVMIEYGNPMNWPWSARRSRRARAQPSSQRAKTRPGVSLVFWGAPGEVRE